MSPEAALLAKLKKLQAANPRQPLTLRELGISHGVSPMSVRELAERLPAQIQISGRGQDRVVLIHGVVQEPPELDAPPELDEPPMDEPGDEPNDALKPPTILSPFSSHQTLVPQCDEPHLHLSGCKSRG